MSGLNTERVCLGAMSLGLSRGAYECALKYAKERVQFGKPIASFPAHPGEARRHGHGLIELSRLITYKGAKMADLGLHREMNLVASYAKLFTARAAMKITTEAVQVLGGYGYMKEFPVERMMRDAKLQQIGGGTDEVQIMIIARDILGIERSLEGRLLKKAHPRQARTGMLRCASALRRMSSSTVTT